MPVPVFLPNAAVHLWDPGNTARGASLLYSGQFTQKCALPLQSAFYRPTTWQNCCAL